MTKAKDLRRVYEANIACGDISEAAEARMLDETVGRIIRQALDDARAKGRDYLTQTQVAVEAVRQARPDMTASDALAAVELVRRQ